MRSELVLKLEFLSYNLDLKLSLFHVDLLLGSYNHLLDGFSLHKDAVSLTCQKRAG